MIAMSLDTHHDVEISPCRKCESQVFDDERFCEVCGTRVVEEAAQAHADAQRASDREELDLGSIAAISDRGLVRRRNEDAMAIALSGDRSLAVVCDGVASTANPDLAARAAAEEVLLHLEPLLSTAEPLTAEELAEQMRAAFARAQQAVLSIPDDEPDGSDLSPSTTAVAAIVTPERIVVGNVGDSRAYWLSRHDCQLLTTDDSMAEEMIAEGMAPEDAYTHPNAHGITRWVGADAESEGPALVEMPVPGPGVLLLCTDGLWNYFRNPAQLGDLVFEAGTPPVAGATAKRLTDAALESGGRDNITVAVCIVPPNPKQTNGRTEE